MARTRSWFGVAAGLAGLGAGAWLVPQASSAADPPTTALAIDAALTAPRFVEHGELDGTPGVFVAYGLELVAPSPSTAATSPPTVGALVDFTVDASGALGEVVGCSANGAPATSETTRSFVFSAPVSDLHTAQDVDPAARVLAGGTWTCALDGAKARVTVAGFDADPDTSPAKAWDGTPLPTDQRVLSAGAVTLFVPDSAIGAGGLATVAVSAVAGSIDGQANHGNCPDLDTVAAGSCGQGSSRQDSITTTSAGTQAAALVVYHWVDGPPPAVGAPLVWNYAVTNTGTAPFSQVNVMDSLGVGMTASKPDGLAPGATWSFTLTGVQSSAEVHSTANATGWRSDGAPVPATHDATSAVTPSIVTPTTGTPNILDPGAPESLSVDPTALGVPAGTANDKVELHVYVNGYEYTSSPGPLAVAGSDNLIEYEIKNKSSSTAVTNVLVDDSSITNDAAILDCGFDDTTKNKIPTLEAGTTEVCSRTIRPVAGNATFTVAVTVGGAADATLPAGYQAKTAALDLQLSVNGNDADTAPGPSVTTNSILTFSYNLHNTGQVDLSAVLVSHVNDADGVYDGIACATIGDDTDGDNTIDLLKAGQSVMCTFTPRAVSGAFSTEATAVGSAVTADGEDLANADGPIEISANDKLNYTGVGTGSGSGTTTTTTGTVSPVVTTTPGTIGNGGADTGGIVIAGSAVFVAGFGMWSVARRRASLR